MLIYIPTAGRVDNQITFKSLPKRYQKRVVFVTLPQETKAMTARYGSSCLAVLPQKGKGVAAARQTAVDHQDGFDHLCFLDDDLRFSVRVKDWDYETNNRALKMDPSDIEAGLRWLQHTLESGVVCACLGARGANNGIRKRWVNENYRVMRSFGVSRSALEQVNVRFDDFYYWEDFHVALTLLEQGHKNVVSTNWLTDGVTNSKGGVVRNLNLLWREAQRFVSLHPTATIVEKKFKHGARSEAQVTFPDLRIAWKKTLPA